MAGFYLSRRAPAMFLSRFGLGKRKKTDWPIVKFVLNESCANLYLSAYGLSETD
jgi:hypothetical protein